MIDSEAALAQEIARLCRRYLAERARFVDLGRAGGFERDCAGQVYFVAPVGHAELGDHFKVGAPTLPALMRRLYSPWLGTSARRSAANPHSPPGLVPATGDAHPSSSNASAVS